MAAVAFKELLTMAGDYLPSVGVCGGGSILGRRRRNTRRMSMMMMRNSPQPGQLCLAVPGMADLTQPLPAASSPVA